MTKIAEQLPKYEDEGVQCRHSKILKRTDREQFSQKLLDTPESIVDIFKQTMSSSFSLLIILLIPKWMASRTVSGVCFMA